MSEPFWQQAKDFSAAVGDLPVSEAGKRIAVTAANKQELQSLIISCASNFLESLP